VTRLLRVNVVRLLLVGALAPVAGPSEAEEDDTDS
jgi:hypothetical protein